MPTPSIQTLRADAQQVLNLDSISAVRSVVAATLANANAGTPLNPNLTTQQLWNEFYQIVTQPKSDIESIIANQLMKFLFAPPAPGGVGANGQVIFNDGGVLAGDPQFLWNKTTNLLTVTGSATITGDLTVDTSTLKVDSANNRVGIGTASPSKPLEVYNTTESTVWANTTTGIALLRAGGTGGDFYFGIDNSTGGGFGQGNYSRLIYSTGAYPIIFSLNASERYRIASDGVATWSNVGGVAGTAMTLNSTGLLVGTTNNFGNSRLCVQGTAGTGTPDVTIGTPVNSGGNTNLAIGRSAATNGYIYLDAYKAAVGGAELALNSINGGTVLIGLSTLVAAGGCLQLKSGITFPATQVASSDANTLDDYEEGTWVGTLKGATTDPTIAVTATGRYTKVGRLVSVQISFSNVNTTGASGDAYIIGLPFANSSITVHGSAASYLALTFSGYLGSEADPGGTNISLFDIRSGNVWASAQHSAGTSRYINAELTYTVA
jgi:hypothetical protein